MFKSTDPRLPFYVANHVDLNQQDEQVLIKLYQPIVGAVATSVYLTLNDFIDQVPIQTDFSRLVQLQEQLDLDLPKLFHALHRLEAALLIKTYTKENKAISDSDALIFDVQPVLSPKAFFETFLLSSLLLEKVGEFAFKKLQKKFLPIRFVGLKDATEVSAGFFEVYHLDQETVIDAPQLVVDAAKQFDDTQVVEQQTQVPETKEIVYQKPNSDGRVSIDWNYLRDLLSAYHIEQKQVEQHQKEISDLINFYEINEQDFVRLAAITFSPGDTKLNIRKIQQILAENNQTAVKVVNQTNATTETPEKVAQEISQLTESDQKVLTEVNSLSPIRYLEETRKKTNGFVSQSERKLVFELQSKYGLKNDLVNILIKTVLSQSTMLSRPLTEKIANDWLQNNVTSAAKALIYLANREQKQQQKTAHKAVNYRYNNRNNKPEIATNWDDQKEKQPTNSSKYSQAELDKLLKNIKKNKQD